jgi:uncharacterized protein (TIGR02301 family)
VKVVASALAVVLAAASTLAAARAQDRTPAQRQTLSELAYVLGESHALRQVCQGAGDQFWRDRMSQLLQTETPDEAVDRSLRESFNTGYGAAQAQFTACDDHSRTEAAAVARRGAALAEEAGRP